MNINPILFALLAVVVTYIILYVDFNFENKKLNNKTDNKKCICPKLNVTYKLPLIIGILVWLVIYYYDNYNNNFNISDSITNTTSLFEQDVNTDFPDF